MFTFLFSVWIWQHHKITWVGLNNFLGNIVIGTKKQQEGYKIFHLGLSEWVSG